MSNTVDQRIVQMQFDNAQFEKGIAVTMASLKKFDKELQLKEGVTGIKNIDAAISKVDFQGMSSALDDINGKFSVLGIAGATAISRITNKLMDVGSQVVKGLTIAPLTDGLDEYNLKLNSIKTIQANTGLTDAEGMKRINNVLSNLNDYADQTIYNFAEMTRNIGTFTAAGVGLEESATAIQGIANLAAMSGSNSQQASTAMYQLSQALASGTVKLMDWNSVVNAGMGGTKFQNMLIETSRVLHTGADEYIEATGSFRESLKGNWLTSEVLTKTLRNLTFSNEELTENYRQTLLQEGYNEDQIASILQTAKLANEAATKVKSFSQLIDTTKEALGSGWAETWEYIQGDITQAERLWTGISNGLNDIIGGFDKTRNDFFRAWNTGEIREFLDGQYVSKQIEGVTSGWESLFEALKNLAGLMGDIVAPITEAFEAVFHIGESAQMLGIEAAKASARFRDFTAEIKKSFEESATGQAIVNALRIAFTMLFSVIKGIGFVVGGAFVVAFEVITRVVGLAANAIEFFASGIRRVFEFFQGLNFESIIGPIKSFFTDTLNLPEIGNAIDHLLELGDAFSSVGNSIKIVGDDGQENLVTGTKALAELLDILRDDLSGLLTRAGEALGGFADGLGKVANAAGNAFFEGLIWSFEQLSKIWSAVQPVFEGIKEKVSGLWTALKEAFSSSGFSFEPFMNMFKGIGDSISSFIDEVIENGFSFDAIGRLFNGIGTSFGGLIDSLGGSLDRFFSTLAENVDGPLGDFIDQIRNAENPISALIGLFSNLGSSIAGFFSKGFSKGNTDSPLTAISSLYDISGAIVDLGAKLKDPIGTISSFLSNVLNGFLDAIDQFVTSIDSEKLSNFIQKIGQLGALGGVIAGLYEFLQFVKSARGLVDSIAAVPEAIEKAIGTFGDIGDAIKDRIKVGMFKEIAISVAILVASLFALTLIPKDKLEQVVPYLAGMVITLTAIMVGFSKIAELDGFNVSAISKFGKAALRLGVAIGILAGIIFILGSIPPEALARGTAVTIGISAVLVGLTAAISRVVKTKKLTKAIDSVRQVSKVILALGAMVAILGLIPEQALGQGALALISIATIIGILMGVLSYLNPVKMSASVKGVATIGLAITEIAGAIAGLAIVASLGGDILGATLAIGGIFLALGLFTSMIAEVEPIQFMETAKSMLVLSAAVGILALAVGGLALISLTGADLVTATEAIAVLIAVLAAASYILGAIGPELAGVDATLISFAIVIGVLAAAIIAFSFVPVESLQQGVTVVVIAIAALAVAAFALGAIGKFFAAGFIALTIFAVGIGVAAIGIGAGCLMIAASLAILASQGPEAAQSFVEALKVLGQGLWDAKEEIALGIAGVVTGILGGLLLCIPGAIDVMLQMLAAIAVTIIAAVPMLVEAAMIAVIALINGLADAIETYGPQLEAAIGHLFEVIINAVHNKIIGALDEFNAFLYNTTGGLMGVEPQAKEAGEKTAEGYAEGVESGKANVDAATQALNEQLMQKLNQTKNDVGDQASHLFDGAGISAEGLDLSSLETLAPELNDMLKQQGYEGLDGLYDGASMRLQEGGNVSTEDWVKSLFGTGDFSASADAVTDQKAAETIALWDQNVAEHASESNAGATVASSLDTEGMRANLINSVTSLATGATEAFNGMFKMDVAPPIQESTSALTAAAPVFGTESQAAGQAGTNGVDVGLTAFVDKVRAKTSGASTAISSIGPQMYSSGYGVGAQAGNGLIAGMNSALGRVQAKASELAQAASAAISKSLEVKSPSRVTTRIGEYVGEGLVIGMDHMIGNVQSSASGIGSAVIMEIMTQASMIADAIDKLEADPVITPVIDTSMVESGISYISDLISQSQAMSISAIDFGVGNMLHPMDAQASLQPAGPVYNLYIDGAIVNSTPEIQRVIYDTFEVVSMYGGMNHGD